MRGQSRSSVASDGNTCCANDPPGTANANRRPEASVARTRLANVVTTASTTSAGDMTAECTPARPQAVLACACAILAGRPVRPFGTGDLPMRVAIAADHAGFELKQ